MRWMTAAAFSILALAVAHADPLAEARAGKLQCYRPDTTRKTCGALSGYAFQDGTIINSADVLLAPQPVVIMRTATPVVLKGEAVCGPLRKEDIDSATILVNGTALPEEKAVQARAQIATAFKDQLGHEVCTTYVLNGDKLSAQVTLDGVVKPEFTQTVIWVKPEDGYSVGP